MECTSPKQIVDVSSPRHLDDTTIISEFLRDLVRSIGMSILAGPLVTREEGSREVAGVFGGRDPARVPRRDSHVSARRLGVRRRVLLPALRGGGRLAGARGALWRPRNRRAGTYRIAAFTGAPISLLSSAAGVGGVKRGRRRRDRSSPLLCALPPRPEAPHDGRARRASSASGLAAVIDEICTARRSVPSHCHRTPPRAFIERSCIA